jgi:hypothetical protein
MAPVPQALEILSPRLFTAKDAKDAKDAKRKKSDSILLRLLRKSSLIAEGSFTAECAENAEKNVF